MTVRTAAYFQAVYPGRQINDTDWDDLMDSVLFKDSSGNVQVDGLIRMAGSTSSFPALKRSLTAIKVRLADDSADAPLTASGITVGSGTSGAPTVVGTADATSGLYFESYPRMSQSGTLLTRWVAYASPYVVHEIGCGALFLSLFASGDPFTVDTRLERRSAGVVEINNGTLGTERDLRLRNLLDQDGNQVVSTRGAAVADASGGAVIDTEARTAINALLARLRTHGLIAT